MDEENKNDKTGINKVLAGACVLLTIAVIGLGMAYGKAKVQAFEAVNATASESQYQGCNMGELSESGSSNGSTTTFGCH